MLAYTIVIFSSGLLRQQLKGHPALSLHVSFHSFPVYTVHQNKVAQRCYSAHVSEARLPVIPRTDYRSDPDRTEIGTNCRLRQQTLIIKKVQIFHVDPVLMCTCSVRPLTTRSLLTTSKHTGNKTKQTLD